VGGGKKGNNAREEDRLITGKEKIESSFAHLELLEGKIGGGDGK